MFSADLGVNQVASTPAATDPPFQKVALLLHGDGTNGAQNNTFTDSSSNAFTITRTGNVAQGTFSPFSLAEGQWSNYFDGNGDYLSVPANAAFEFGTGDFTIEGWFFFNSISSIQSFLSCYASSVTGWTFQFRNDSGNIISFSPLGDSVTAIKASYTPTIGDWTHLAVTRSGTDVRIFANGAQIGTTTSNSTNIPSLTTTLKIGSLNPSIAGQYFNGYISNVRVVKGTALYTSNFTPSATPLTAVSGTSLLTCQSNLFKDNSSNNFTITRNGDTKVTAWSPFAPSTAYDAGTNGGSAYFDGSGDYLVAADNAALGMSTGDFTIEFWVNTTRAINTGTNDQWIFDTRPSGTSSGTNQIQIKMLKTTGTITATLSAGSIAGTTVCEPNTWNHVAVVKSSGTTKLYVNGIQTGSSYTDTNDYGSSRNVVIGEVGDARTFNGYFTGYLSDVRVVKGTAVYTTNFTPPTAPLTAISGTSLLLNCVNAGIYDNSGKNDIETVGNAQISTSVKKYGTGSMAFDGTGDGLLIPNNDLLTFGTGNFTIECWVYRSGSGVIQGVFDERTAVASEARPTLYITTSNQIAYYTVNANRITASLSQNTWVHVAVVRSSGTTKMYIDGVAQATTFNDTTNYVAPTSGARVGYLIDGYSLNGYIDDLRITKGQALYTSNFIPPTQAFPNF